jgi:hypothetical protein
MRQLPPRRYDPEKRLFAFKSPRLWGEKDRRGLFHTFASSGSGFSGQDSNGKRAFGEGKSQIPHFRGRENRLQEAGDTIRLWGEGRKWVAGAFPYPYTASSSGDLMLHECASGLEQFGPPIPRKKEFMR